MTKFKPELVVKHRVDQWRRAVWQAPYKLIQTGADQVELFNYLTDPQEKENLAVSQPAVLQTMRDLLRNFEKEAALAAIAAERMVEQDDPQLRRHLRALGYLE